MSQVAFHAETHTCHLRSGQPMTVHAAKTRKEFGKTLAVDITHRLRQDIVGCRLKPGEALKFDTLRSAFGASFTTLREALTSLSAEGLVIAEQQRGFRVAPVTTDDLVDVTSRILIEIELLKRSIAQAATTGKSRLFPPCIGWDDRERLSGGHTEDPVEDRPPAIS